MKEKLAEELIRAMGGRYSAELGIDLEGQEPKEVFKWFLAAILFGARISEDIAVRTYHELSKRRLTTPEALLHRDWDGLVEVLDLGGYVRYDFKTATKLQEISAVLVRECQANLNKLHEEAADPRDLERKLMRFKGVGPVTVNIFLREMRGIWGKADPLPSDLALLAAQNLRLVQAENRAQAQGELKGLVPLERLADLEAALVRLGKNFCRKGRHVECPMASRCPSLCENSPRSLRPRGEHRIPAARQRSTAEHAELAEESWDELSSDSESRFVPEKGFSAISAPSAVRNCAYGGCVVRERQSVCRRPAYRRSADPRILTAS